MKKQFMIVMILLFSLCLLTACGGGNTPPSGDGGSSSADAIIIKFSLSQAAVEPTVLAAEQFAADVAERTNGAIVVQVYPDNQLGSERDVIEGLQLHTVEMTAPANAVMTNFISSLNLLELPMMFDNKEHVYAVLDDIGMEFTEECESLGFKLFGFFDLGSRNIMTVKTEINEISDLGGLKIRTQEGQANLAAFVAFGANPTPMAYNELYTALESGVLDGAEAANTNYYSKAFYEVAPNWAMVGWLELVNPVIMDIDFWDSLSDEHQQILEECIRDMIVLERRLYAESEDECLDELIALGVNITYPDKTPFQQASEQVYADYAEMVGGMERIEAILNYAY